MSVHNSRRRSSPAARRREQQLLLRLVFLVSLLSFMVSLPAFTLVQAIPRGARRAANRPTVPIKKPSGKAPPHGLSSRPAAFLPFEKSVPAAVVDVETVWDARWMAIVALGKAKKAIEVVKIKEKRVHSFMKSKALQRLPTEQKSHPKEERLHEIIPARDSEDGEALQPKNGRKEEPEELPLFTEKERAFFEGVLTAEEQRYYLTLAQPQKEMYQKVWEQQKKIERWEVVVEEIVQAVAPEQRQGVRQKLEDFVRLLAVLNSDAGRLKAHTYRYRNGIRQGFFLPEHLRPTDSQMIFYKSALKRLEADVEAVRLLLEKHNPLDSSWVRLVELLIAHTQSSRAQLDVLVRFREYYRQHEIVYPRRPAPRDDVTKRADV